MSLFRYVPFPTTAGGFYTRLTAKRSTASMPDTHGNTFDVSTVRPGKITITYQKHFKHYGVLCARKDIPYWRTKEDAVSAANPPSGSGGPGAPKPTGTFAKNTYLLQKQRDEANGCRLVARQGSDAECWVRSSDVVHASEGSEKRNEPEWGIYGTARYEPASDAKQTSSDENVDFDDLHAITVWQEWKEADGQFATGTMTVPPGKYAAYVRHRDRKSLAEGGPSIFLGWAWDERRGEWKQGLPRLKQHPDPDVGHAACLDIFLHKGNTARDFKGCIGLGSGVDHDATFVGNTSSTIYAILDSVGITKEKYESDVDVRFPDRANPNRPARGKWFVLDIKDPHRIFDRLLVGPPIPVPGGGPGIIV